MKKSEQIIILKAKIIKLKEQLKAARLELADKDNEIYELKCQLGYINNSEFKDAIDNLATFGKQNIGEYFEEMKKAFEKLEVSSLTEKYKPIESTKELFESTMQKVMDKIKESEKEAIKSGVDTTVKVDTTEKILHPIESIGKPFNREDLKLNCTKEDIIYLAKESGLPNVIFEPIESTQELFEGKGYVYELVNGVKFYRTEIGYSTDKTTAKLFNCLESFFEIHNILNLTVQRRFHFEPIQ